MRFVNYLRKFFAFCFCLVKGKIAFLCVLQIMRKLRTHTDMRKDIIRSRTQHRRLNFQKAFSVRHSLPNRPRDLEKGLQGSWPPSTFHLCVVAAWPLSGYTLNMCKRLPEKQQQQSGPILNIQVCIILSSSGQGITVLTLSSNAQCRWGPLSLLYLSHSVAEKKFLLVQ